METIDPSIEYGAFLKTRFLGEHLRSAIEARLEAGKEIRIDFSSIAGMSHSFADECFGDLFGENGPDLFRTRLHLVGLNEAGRSVLRLVFTDRSGKQPA